MAELMVSVTVLLIGFMGILALLNRSLGLSRTVSDSYSATYLAAEGIEVVKNILDSNHVRGRAWNEGVAGAYEIEYDTQALDGNPEAVNQNRVLRYDGGVTKRYSYDGGLPTNFKRRVEIVLVDANEVKANSIVEWTTRGTSFNINLEDHFYNWRF